MQNAGFYAQILVCIVATLYFQFKENPIYAKTDIKIITNAPLLEEHLSRFKDVIGFEYDGYRNHLYRVLTYTNHFLGGDETNRDVIETALVYHDIGLWTARTLAYLEPGVELARKECTYKYTPEQLELQDSIIINHHKIWPSTQRIVEAVRKADWIDASNGIFNKGMPRSHISAVKAALPAAGFYKTLAEIGPRLHGSNVVAIVTEIVTIFRW
jgi:hypothetical protein